MGKNEIRPTLIYKMENNRTSIEIVEKDHGVVLQDTLLPEKKHIHKIFGDI